MNQKPGRKFKSKNFSWIVATTIALTTSLLIISSLLALALWQKEQDSGIYGLIVTFCIFNVAETFLSVYLLMSTVTLEYNNHGAIMRLLWKLKQSGSIDEQFYERIVNEYKKIGY